jgi:hypothetical protein
MIQQMKNMIITQLVSKIFPWKWIEDAFYYCYRLLKSSWDINQYVIQS